ncbi:hypothetical protein [Frigoriglobus tundricola]|uniref:Uncharacterized protein n=1 Tax=Frigoriglobus tundricola TaxID=2774151 RepID=A0A6M5Z127_9BACT|nr:hypothetical protein [Frigoriglobus tundricola]QJW99111.1 hypothetical protein FTUN_6709 [Frigoriglobus tundricola]
MDVSIDSLFARIGRQLIEIEMLRAQVAAKDQAVATAEAEVARLQQENATLKSSAKPKWTEGDA